MFIIHHHINLNVVEAYAFLFKNYFNFILKVYKVVFFLMSR